MGNEPSAQLPPNTIKKMEERLITAARSGSSAEVQQLLDQNVNVNSRGVSGAGFGVARLQSLSASGYGEYCSHMRRTQCPARGRPVTHRTQSQSRPAGHGKRRSSS